MELKPERILSRKYIRIRDRNQITLPSRIIAGLPMQTGDFLEICRTKDGFIYLRPTTLVTMGTPEAQQEEAQADKDIAEGRYGTFDSAEELMQDLRKRRQQPATPQSKKASTAKLPSLKREPR